MFSYSSYDGSYDQNESAGSCELYANLYEEPAAQRLEKPLTVSELTQRLKAFVKEAFPYVLRVVGEVSSLSVPKSGHAYFTLKDQDSQLPALAWRSTMQQLPFKLQNGMKVVCSGKLDVYPQQGRWQLVATSVEPVGVGSYQLALKQLERKLRQEGLFEPGRKRPLPPIVNCVGVATSLTGAAIRDFLNTLAKRSKRVNVIVAPTKVQGEGAAQEIVKALEVLNAQRKALKIDAIALIRGGGSVEDLWSFNDESVVRAIAASALPVVTGVGHELDVSLCDLVADAHAVTPTAAATQICQEDSKYAATLDDWDRRMLSRVEQKLQIARERLNEMEKRHVFANPYEVLYEKRAQHLKDLETRMTYQIEKRLASVQERCKLIQEQLAGRDPKAILARGYSFTRRLDDMKILRSPADVEKGQVIETTLAQGTVRSVVID